MDRLDPAVPAGAALEDRLRFTRLGREDRERLAELQRVVDAAAPGLVDRFYEHLERQGGLGDLLGDPSSVERLKRHQLRYVRSLASASYDEAFLEDRRRIGEVHARIGLSPAWYIGTYATFFDELLPRVLDPEPGEPARRVDRARALAKQLLLDMQLVLDVYYARRERRAVSHAEQLAGVGRLAAGVAHEVRNPLAGIRGALQVLSRDPDFPQRHREVMDEVVGQIDRLENLVRDLLTFARPREARPADVELRPFFERHARLAREAGSGVVTRVDIDADAAVVRADVEQLEQVLLNLVQNAVQAMPEGGALTLGSRRRNDRFELVVRDDGEGMDARTAAAALNPFFTTRHRGSGLGLSIVEGIVERHGGRLSIDSTPGGGTTVTLSLPIGAAR